MRNLVAFGLAVLGAAVLIDDPINRAFLIGVIGCGTLAIDTYYRVISYSRHDEDETLS